MENKMKIKYSLAQLAGCLQLIFLLAIVLLWDRMLFQKLPFEFHPCKWHSYMYYIGIFALFEIALSFIVIPYIKNSKKKLKERSGNNPTWREKIIMLISSSCSGNYVDLLFVFLFFFYMAWLPDVCSDFVKEGASPFRLLVYLIGLFVMIVLKPAIYKEPQDVSAESRTLLVTALSNVIITDKGPTIKPIIWPFSDYKNITKVIIVLTDQINLFCRNLKLENEGYINKAYKDYTYGMIGLYCKYCKTDEALVQKWHQVLNSQNQQILDLKDDSDNSKKKSQLLQNIGIDEREPLTLKLLMKSTDDHLLKVEVEHLIRNLIIDCLNAYKIDCELLKLDVNDAVVFTEPVNYDDFDDCNEKCYDKVNSVMRKGKFSDENVIVNITAGTAVVTSVLTLNAIKGNRGMIYRKQNASEEGNPKMTLANPNVMMVQFNELVKEKVEHE